MLFCPFLALTFVKFCEQCFSLHLALKSSMQMCALSWLLIKWVSQLCCSRRREWSPRRRNADSNYRLDAAAGLELEVAVRTGEQGLQHAVSSVAFCNEWFFCFKLSSVMRKTLGFLFALWKVDGRGMGCRGGEEVQLLWFSGVVWLCCWYLRLILTSQDKNCWIEICLKVLVNWSGLMESL